MGRKLGSKNKSEKEADVVDYKSLYETLKREDEMTRTLLAEANKKLADLENKYIAIRKRCADIETKNYRAKK